MIREHNARSILEQSIVNQKNLSILIPRSSSRIMREHRITIMVEDSVVADNYVDDLMPFSIKWLIQRDKDIFYLAAFDYAKTGQLDVKVIVYDIVDSTFVFQIDSSLINIRHSPNVSVVSGSVLPLREVNDIDDYYLELAKEDYHILF